MGPLFVLSLGLTLQTCCSNAHVLQHISQTQPLQDDIRAQFQIDPSPGQLITVTQPIDIIISEPGGTSTTSSTFSVVRGLECGSTVQMYPNNTAEVFSTNFGIGHYYNNEGCNWKFEANQCTLSAHCPCVDIPRSWECLGDYLKIRTDYILENQRFCGGNKPNQAIYSDTDFLSIRFRSDGKKTGTGFTCFIRCEGPGMKIPLRQVNCPTTTSPVVIQG